MSEPLDELRAEGFVILRSLIPPSVIERCRAQAAGLIAAAQNDPSRFRWPNRMMLQVPDGALNEADVRRNAVVEELVTAMFGAKWRRGPLQIEVALPGCDFMSWHGDAWPPDLHRRKRCVRLALQIPLVDVDEVNGAIEVDPRSHLLHFDEWLRATGGEGTSPRKLFTRAGDAFLRDGDLVHRGTPNRGDAPRPMLSQLYFSEQPMAFREVSIRRAASYAATRVRLKFNRRPS